MAETRDWEGVVADVIFQDTRLPKVFEIQAARHSDDRGFFARTWCQREFQEHGLAAAVAQCSISHNRKRGTLRGMHWQAAPFAEAKLVRCTAGAIYDVALDLRDDSPTFLQWFGTVLSSTEGNALYVPEGCGHGFLTLTDDAEVLYQMSEFYHPEAGRGVRWNDPAFGIVWPEEIKTISDRDRSYPDYVSA